MPPRVHVPDLDDLDTLLRVPDPEAVHLRRVLRLAIGDVVSVFDGCGRECLARVEKLSPRDLVVRPYQVIESAPEPAVALTVAVALLKGRKFDDVVRDVTMVGAVAVQPLVTARTEGRVRDVRRWQRIAVSSATQCRRAVVPEVRPVQTLAALLEGASSDARILLAEPDASKSDSGNVQALEAQPLPATALLAVGPEGGWSSEELNLASSAGFRLLTLGRLTMRADAVVIRAVSVLQYIWGDL